jgi:UDP-4-amino-4,6-dideoxy-N-acetyl-beta-L-altrosamine transaminase
MTEPFLPYGKHCVDEVDVAAVSAVLRGDWLTTGPQVEAFEAALAKAVGAKFAVACNSGTAALHLAAMALGLGKDDRVIVPTLTFLASANGPRFTGAEIVFADVDPDTALLTPETLEAAFKRASGRVRGVIPVHMNGQACDMPALAQVATAHGAVLVEDACHALAGTHKNNGGWSPVGACTNSAMACFSFHPVKTIAMGEGGAVTTNDPALDERLRRLRNHGMIRDDSRFVLREQAFDDSGKANPWYYEMAEPGLNYRASDINCALGLSQLQKLDMFAKKRRILAAAYDTRFAVFPASVRPVPRVAYCDPVFHLYALLIEWRRLTNAERAHVMRALAAKGIGTQVHYLPVHRQPYYQNRYGAQDLRGADEYYRRALSIPFYPAMTEADVDRVVATLADVLGLARG